MLASNEIFVMPITFVSTHPTACRRVLHKKLTVAQPTKNWSNFYATLTFITAAPSPELISTLRQLHLHTHYLSGPLPPSATWFPSPKHQQRFAISRSLSFDQEHVALAAFLEHYTAIICRCHLHICRTNHYLSKLKTAPFISERVHNDRMLPTKEVGLTKTQEPMSPNHYNQAAAGREVGKFVAWNNQDCNLCTLWHTNFTKAFFVFKASCGLGGTRVNVSSFHTRKIRPTLRRFSRKPKCWTVLCADLSRRFNLYWIKHWHKIRIHLRLQVRYGFHWADFHEPHSHLIHFYEHLQHRTLPNLTQVYEIWAKFNRNPQGKYDFHYTKFYKTRHSSVVLGWDLYRISPEMVKKHGEHA